MMTSTVLSTLRAMMSYQRCFLDVNPEDHEAQNGAHHNNHEHDIPPLGHHADSVRRDGVIRGSPPASPAPWEVSGTGSFPRKSTRLRGSRRNGPNSFSTGLCVDAD